MTRPDPTPSDTAAIRSAPLFDSQAFALEVRLAMAKANKSLRQLQAICGVDQASIHRVAKKQLPPSVETYLRLRHWMDAPPHPDDSPNGETK